VIKVLIVDDEMLVRYGLFTTIDWESYGFEIVGDAKNGKVALELVNELQPDIIISDIRMPIMDGLEFICELKNRGIEKEVVILSGYDDFNYAKKALEYGASAYLLKPIENDELINVLLKLKNKLENRNRLMQTIEGFNEGLEILKQKFLIDLINGEYNKFDSIKEKLDLYRITPQFEKLCFSLIKTDNGVNVLDNILNVNVQNEKKYATPFININGEVCVIWFFDDDDIIDQINSYLGKVEFISAFVTGSAYNSWMDIKTAYDEARNMINDNIEKNGVLLKDVETPNYRKEIKEALEYIKNNYNKNISVEQVANELFLSSYYFMHIFKKNVGKTFNEYLVQYRIEIAKQLLRDTKYKVFQVSELVGYKNTKYFSQLFKRETGLLPKEYVDTINNNK